ncbi:Beta-lactamase/transpeptidase-like protein [Akanthomyces lecanii RCEF 1005]|uniref:Beta-lactamase/transpeptidase-like protein n=1 Tax=Akanthomyces lecanii RCEF 1005 TaxID=1081108 RepID=A0A162KGX4_CORDF|nr:Beta-lactamase/transpeptidase-like protein [Akanthomyces lecanii RCEF 1005]
MQVVLAAAAALAAPLVEIGEGSVPIVTKGFEDFVRLQMSTGHVPGMAISIIDGNNTWSKGYGYSTDDHHSVTPSTLFFCGSMTKSNTAAALSIIVDDTANSSSPVRWDTPVSKLMPEFVLSDKWATDHITITDALCHRTGYPRHDLSGPYHNNTEEMIGRFRYLPMSAEPRAKWQYNNMMFGTMGHVVERLSNTTLACFFRDRLWRPMGMNHTYLHPGEAHANGEDLATSFYWDNDTQRLYPMPQHDESNLAGAGMAVSSVEDWSKYLQNMLDESGPMSKAGHTMIKKSHMVIDEGIDVLDAAFTGQVNYALGWNMGVFENEPVWYHSGYVNQMVSFMLFVPNRRFAYVAMMNTNSLASLDAITARVLNDHFKVEPNKRFNPQNAYDKYKETSSINLDTCPQLYYPALVSAPQDPGAPMDNFLGTYHNDGYGTIAVSRDCDWQGPANAPTVFSVADGHCVLRVQKGNSFGNPLSYRLQHVSGGHWVAWLYMDDYPMVKRPTACYRAQFELDGLGMPVNFGIDMRDETADTPLVWFARTI